MQNSCIACRDNERARERERERVQERVREMGGEGVKSKCLPKGRVEVAVGLAVRVGVP